MRESCVCLPILVQSDEGVRAEGGARGGPGAAERQAVAAALWAVSCCPQDKAG